MENLFEVQDNRTYVKVENMYEAMISGCKFPDVSRRESRRAKAELKWIEKLLARNKQRVEQLLPKVLFGISTHNMPVCLMTISAFVYYSNKHGLDNVPLIDTIYANLDWLVKNHGGNMYNYLTR